MASKLIALRSDRWHFDQQELTCLLKLKNFVEIHQKSDFTQDYIEYQHIRNLKFKIISIQYIYSINYFSCTFDKLIDKIWLVVYHKFYFHVLV